LASRYDVGQFARTAGVCASVWARPRNEATKFSATDAGPRDHT